MSKEKEKPQEVKMSVAECMAILHIYSNWDLNETAKNTHAGDPLQKKQNEIYDLRRDLICKATKRLAELC